MKLNPWKVSTVVLASALTFVLSTAEFPSAQAEKQPHMKAALASLKLAKEQLEKATADKGGHRVKAIALTKDAIGEVEQGIAHDNAH